MFQPKPVFRLLLVTMLVAIVTSVLAIGLLEVAGVGPLLRELL